MGEVRGYDGLMRVVAAVGPIIIGGPGGSMSDCHSLPCSAPLSICDHTGLEDGCCCPLWRDTVVS